MKSAGSIKNGLKSESLQSGALIPQYSMLVSLEKHVNVLRAICSVHYMCYFQIL